MQSQQSIEEELGFSLVQENATGIWWKVYPASGGKAPANTTEVLLWKLIIDKKHKGGSFMKKLLAQIVSLFGLAMAAVLIGYGITQAALPMATRVDGNSGYHTVIQGSTATVSTNDIGGISVTVPASSGFMNCLDFVDATLPIGATFYLLDGGTTNYTRIGYTGTISSATANGLSGANGLTGYFARGWQQTEPYCGTAGNALIISIPAPASNPTFSAFSYEGYTTAAPKVQNQN